MDQGACGIEVGLVNRRLCREQLLEARETIARLNRRCQGAESGLLAKSTSVRFKSAVEHALRQQLEVQRRLAHDDRAALDRLQTMMSGRVWLLPAELLMAIADVIRQSGREVKRAKQNSPRWDALGLYTTEGGDRDERLRSTD